MNILEKIEAAFKLIHKEDEAKKHLRERLCYFSIKGEWCLREDVSVDALLDSIMHIIRTNKYDQLYNETKAKALRKVFDSLDSIKYKKNHPEVKDYLARNPEIDEGDLEINRRIKYLREEMLDEIKYLENMSYA